MYDSTLGKPTSSSLETNGKKSSVKTTIENYTNVDIKNFGINNGCVSQVKNSISANGHIGLNEGNPKDDFSKTD